MDTILQSLHEWSGSLLFAALMTVIVAVLGFLLGIGIGAGVCCALLEGGTTLRIASRAYITLLRAIPDLLVIYLLYFGGASALGSLAALAGYDGFIGLPPFPTGVVALGIVSGAYQAAVFRGAYLAIPRGQFEAAMTLGMGRWTMAYLITGPLVLRNALPGMGNIWQMVLKESALISIVGLVELMRQAQVAAGSTSQPFLFYTAAAALYLSISFASSMLFRYSEKATSHGVGGR